MLSYHISNFNAKTPKDEQSKLESALRSVNGVEKVSLNPSKGDFSLSFTANKEPKLDMLTTAVKKAGFTLGKKNS